PLFPLLSQLPRPKSVATPLAPVAGSIGGSPSLGRCREVEKLRVQPNPPQTGAKRRVSSAQRQGAAMVFVAASALAWLAIVTEYSYLVPLCMTQLISTIPLAGACTSPLGSATRS